MKSFLYIGIGGLLLLSLSNCGKSSDYYYKDFLDQAEVARPGMVDSLQIMPGHNRANLRFLVAPDRRVHKLKIKYSTSLSADVTEIDVDIAAQDYAKYKDVLIENLPESTVMVDIISFSASNDISNIARASAQVYGSQYVAALSNRIFVNFSTSQGVPQINFLGEAGLPQNKSVFTPMQSTEIVYPTASGDSLQVNISPYDNFALLPEISEEGTLKFRTLYKPVETSIDVFAGPWTNVAF